MTTSFERTVGPKADYQELEYISSLHQTGTTGTRTTGTISSLDVQRFLKSRYSMDISHAQAQDVVRGLGGDDGESATSNGSNAHGSTQLQMSVARQVAQRIRSEREQQRLLEQETAKNPTLRWRRSSAQTTTGSELSSREQQQSTRSGTGDVVDRGQRLVEEALNPTIVYLDLVQVTSILLIPTLARMAQEWRQQQGSEGTSGNANQQGEDSEDNDDFDNDEFEPLDPQPKGLLEFVHSIMVRVMEAHDDGKFHGTILGEDIEVQLHDNDKSSKSDPPMLTPELVEALLLENGETERASDEQLVQEMFQMAQSKTSDGAFDMEALVNALTSDLQDWEVGCEDSQTTYFSDVFGLKSMDHEFNEFVTGETTVDWEQKSASQRNTADHQLNNPPEVEAASDASPSTPASIMKDEPTNRSNQPDNDDDETAPPTPQSNTTDLAELEATTTTTIPEDSQLKIKGSAKVIDAVVDSYASHMTLTLVWVTYVLHSGSYASLILATDTFQTECPGEQTFGCTLGKTVYTWIIVALVLVCFGFVVLAPLAYGNHPTKRGPIRMFTASVLALAITLVPFLIVYRLKQSDLVFYQAVEDQLNNESYFMVVIFTTALGCILTLNYFAHFLIAFGRQFGMIEKDNNKLAQSGGFGKFLARFSTTFDVRRSAGIKRAATRKINMMLTNAREMHGLSSSEQEAAAETLAASVTNNHNSAQNARAKRRSKLAQSIRKAQSDAVFQNYTLRGERKVKAGSLLWSWGMILSGGLWETEGIWLPSRMIIFQLAQVVIGCFYCFLLFVVVDVAADAADKATAEIESKLLQQLYYPQWVLDFVPTGQEVRWALLPAACISVFVCFALTILYIPSTVKTTLKYRCGQLPSLGSPAFNHNRAAADLTYMNTANAIYGMIAGASLFFFLFGLLIFLFIWDFSQHVMLLLLAWGIGLTITTVLKSVMVSFCRKRLFRAFYRVFPGRSNYVTLALECWYIGLGGGVLIGRLTQFLLASAFWIGRIDEPMIADNVNLLGYKFDYVPLNYSSEILIHEAHRHPFIERLGAMYMMRIKHKKSFGSDAGACWRQLFVLTLMPWLVKNRVFHEQRASESVEDQESELELERDENKRFAEIAQDLLDVGAENALTVGKVGLGTVDVGAKAVGQVGHVGLETVDVGTKAVGHVGHGAVKGVKAVGHVGHAVGHVGVEAVEKIQHRSRREHHDDDDEHIPTLYFT